jgi:DNA repair protein SbcD/Mre11
MVRILHLSDIHLGSGFAHGKINPETGLNTRLEDFVATLEKCIDRAISEPVDLVLFGGDAFPDATPPPYIQQAFASQFRRLVDANTPAVLLVGNHDQHSQGVGGASLCIYRTLGVPNVVVGDRLETHRIQTRSGEIQVITLPWLTRSTLLTRPETEGLSMSDVGHLLLDRLRVAMEGEIRKLDPDIPTVLLAHLMVDAANYGAERFLAVGKGFTIPLEFLTRDAFDYVALGHVHRHQILSEDPFVIYPGSIERVDFSEEDEDKGFILADVECGSTEIEFCTVPARSFCTIEADLTESDTPQIDLLEAIAKQDIEEAVVRVIYQVRPEQIDLIDDAVIHEALEFAHTYTIQAGLISQMSRSRLPELGVGTAIEPLDALRAYLANREDLKLLADPILEAAKSLLAQEEFYIESDENFEETQLRLL